MGLCYKFNYAKNNFSFVRIISYTSQLKKFLEHVAAFKLIGFRSCAPNN